MAARSVDFENLLRDKDVLVRRELVASGARGAGDLRIGIGCGRPLLYPVPAVDLPPFLRQRAEATGVRYAGALFAFDLDAPPPGHRYAAAHFAVALDDEEVIAVQVYGDGGQIGLLYGDGAVEAASPLADVARAATAERPGLLRRLGVRVDRPTAWTTGAQTARFGWSYAESRSTPILPRTYGVHALLELPAGAGPGPLTGTLSADVDVVAMARRRASMGERAAFSVPLPGPAAQRAAAVRLCMAADVAGYSTRANGPAERLQHDLVEVLAAARLAAGIRASDVDPQPQGDGQFTVLPVGIDESAVIPRLTQGLATALARCNLGRDDRMRLRVALHRGLVKPADNGWVGRAAVAVHRILDAPPLRAALAGNPNADFVLGVPDVLFLDVLAHTDGPPPPDAFGRITVDLPDKHFLEPAWLYVATSEAGA